MNLQESITELESLILLQKSGTFSTNFVYICIACINVVFFIFRDLPLHPESQYGSCLLYFTQNYFVWKNILSCSFVRIF